MVLVRWIYGTLLANSVNIANIAVTDNQTPFSERQTYKKQIARSPIKMVVVNFPDHHRDLAGMRGDGFAFSTPSDMAVKMYDALLHQMIYHFEDPQLGGSEGTTKVGPFSLANSHF